MSCDSSLGAMSERVFVHHMFPWKAAWLCDPVCWQAYCVDIRQGQLVFASSGEVVDTVGEEFIFVMAPRGELYLGRKRKGYLH